MIEPLAYNPEELFIELKDRARTEGAYTQEAWNDLAEEVIDEHLRVGEMHDDEELSELRESLQARFSEFEAEIR